MMRDRASEVGGGLFDSGQSTGQSGNGMGCDFKRGREVLLVDRCHVLTYGRRAWWSLSLVLFLRSLFFFFDKAKYIKITT